jgi:hypothetical protein
MNCTVSGSIVTEPEPGYYMYCGGIVGINRGTGTVSGCSFEGDIIAAIVGGIVGGNENGGIVSDCHTLTGRVLTVSDWPEEMYSGGIIAYLFPSSSYNITGNTFSKATTGQEWGIGYDPRLSPAAPSNNGAAPIGPID